MSGPVPGAVVLLVSADEHLADSFRHSIACDPTVHLEVASSGASGMIAAKRHRPDLILVDSRASGPNCQEMGARLKADLELSGVLIVLLAQRDDPCLTQEGIGPGLDDILVEPGTPVERAIKVRSLLRLKRALDSLRTDQEELERLHHTLRQSFDQLLALLAHLVDQSVPGAAARGETVARLAALVAERFEIPEEFHRDLAIAGRLHEIGTVVFAETDHRDGAAESAGDEPAVAVVPWQRMVAAQALLQRVDGLRPVAELVGCVYENWDGTGHPDHLQVGQIPLRSRILRTVIDFVETTDQDGYSEDDALELLQSHRGTWYDPLVLSYLESVLRSVREGDWRARRRKVGVGGLRAGMVLADDLTTSSGVKLMSAGSQVSLPALETIHRRHESDPIPHGVWIRR